MDKLTRIIDLDDRMQKNRVEKTAVSKQIEELKNKSRKLDESYTEMKDSKRILERERYSDKKRRKKVINYSERSSCPEVGIKLAPYIDNWDVTIPDDVLDALVKMERLYESDASNRRVEVREIIDNIGRAFIRSGEKGGLNNDN